MAIVSPSYLLITLNVNGLSFPRYIDLLDD